MKKVILAALLAILVTSCIDKSLPQSPFDEAWRAPTQTELITIGRILVKNKVKGCGECQIKGKSPEYLVACHPNDNEWKYYEVLEYTQSVLTPHEKYSSYLTPPY